MYPVASATSLSIADSDTKDNGKGVYTWLMRRLVTKGSKARLSANARSHTGLAFAFSAAAGAPEGLN